MTTTDIATDTLAAACQIGDQLCASAVWDADGQQCNWMGRSELSGLHDGASSATAALGGHLYAGSLGVALFLGELGRQTGERVYLHTAGAALRRSLAYMRSVSLPISPISVWAGALGQVYVAARLSAYGVDGAGADEIERLLVRVADGLAEPHGLDIMGGNAGAIPVLLALARHPGLAHCRDLAVACGAELRMSAQWSGSLCYWDATRTSGSPTQTPPWTGLSHGASGIALALLELYCETGEAELLRMARGAFAYEDTLFSAPAGNWIDVRSPYSQQPSGLVGTCATVWCHGAPGIALARLRARALDPELASSYEAMARLALSTTAAAISHNLQQPQADTSLCHGLCGLGEVLLLASDMLGDAGYRATAQACAQQLIARYGVAGTWPSGVIGQGPNPSLMLGSAGVAYHFLRLADLPSVPPVLLMAPDLAPIAAPALH